jgi:putative DNA primase/helicase
MTARREKPAVLPVTHQTIPEDLRLIPNWVCWQLVFKEGATKPWTKVPMNARTGYPAKTNDPSTWVPFREALKAALESPDLYDGIGFVFTIEAGYVGVDLDQCRDPQTGEIETWARDIMNALESYTEVTPSGTGMHIIVRGKIPAGRKKGQIELYATGRYFTFTGRHLEGTPLGIEERPEAILKVVSDLEEPQMKWGKVGGQNGARPAPTASATPTVEDERLLEHAKKWRNGDKTADLWNGVWQVWFPSQSEADQSLCDTLAFLYDKDAARIDRMFRRSGLMREKWDESHRGDGATYGELTVAKAIAGTRETYKPRRDTGGGGVARPALPSAAGLNYRRADQIEATDVQWIWDGVLAVGKLTIFAGDPKVGKTLAAEDIAARITTQAAWPDGGTAPLGTVLLFEVEDAESDTTKPRLIAHGADLTRVYIYGPEHGDVTDSDGSRRAFSLDRDLPALRKAILDTQASVVIISPVMTFMGQKDSMRDQEVRQVLTPLVALAAELKVAVVAVIHLNKADDKKAMHRIQASMAFAAVARVVRVFAKDPDEKGRHLMLSIGGNNTADNAGTPSYRIGSWCWHCQKPARGKRCQECKAYSVAKMEWGAVVEEVDVERVMGRPTQKTEEEKTRPAADNLLYEMVPDADPVLVREIYAEAEKRGIPIATLKSARYRQRLDGKKDAFHGGWVWWRPQGADDGEGVARARVQENGFHHPFVSLNPNRSMESTKSYEETTPSVDSSLRHPFVNPSQPAEGMKGRHAHPFVGALNSKGGNDSQPTEGMTPLGEEGNVIPPVIPTPPSAAPTPWSLIQ